jgi:hypothetical protein
VLFALPTFTSRRVFGVISFTPGQAACSRQRIISIAASTLA